MSAPPAPDVDPGFTLTRDRVRAVDRIAVDRFGLPGPVLMENAGRGCADLLLRELGDDRNAPVAILCGPGNNGGDGFVIARHLANRGVPVRTVLIGDPDALPDDAAMNHGVVRAMDLSPAVIAKDADDDAVTAALTPILEDAAWVVDALLGTGAGGAPRGAIAAAVRAAGDARGGGAKIFAVDLPTGFDADDGPADPACCVRADLTGTFVARKPACDRADAAAWLGRVEVVNIGVPRAAIALAATNGSAPDVRGS